MNNNNNSGTILIVDDNLSNLNLFTDTLELHGYEVLVALSGESGIEKATYAIPDLILLDVMLPGIDGFEVCRQLKQSPITADIPVIFMTALHEISSKVEGFQAGAVDYVNKPIQQDEILQRVQIHLRLHQLTHKLEQEVSKQTQALREANQQLQEQISERRQAQADLLAERNLLRTLVNTIPDFIYVKDRESRFVVANQAVADIMGQSNPEDVIGKRDSDFLQDVDSAKFFREEQELMANGIQMVNHEEYFYSERAQRYSHILTTKVPLYNDNDEIIGLVGIGKDISAYKQAQDQIAYHAMLLAKTSDAIISTDKDLLIQSWNVAAEKLYGWTAAEAMNGYAPSLFQSNFSGMPFETFLKVLTENKTYSGEFIHHHKSGRELPILSNITVLTDDNGEITGYVSINRDNTLQKQHEAQQLAIARMNERTEVLNNLLGSISHDLKTPLTIIETNLHLMERATTPERRAEKSIAIRRQTQRLQRLIEDLLTMSRLDHLPSLTLSKVNIDQLLVDITTSLDQAFRSKTQTINLSLGTVPIIQANETELYRAFFNLVENAINYTGESGTVTISTYSDGSDVFIEVHDNGIGIGEEDIHRVFERYYRADKARNIYTGGSGLGLAITKRIIEIHGGDIAVTSQLDHGTIFRVILPITN